MRKLFLLLPLFLAASELPGIPSGIDSGNSHPHTRLPVSEVPEVCATGCSASPMEVGRLSQTEFQRLFEAFRVERLEPGSPALEALLFHGAATRGFLASEVAPLLDREHLDYLQRELDRDSAFLSVRIIDEKGLERLRLDEARLPLGEKQHLHPESTEALPPPEISGTLQRVGVEHLWARL